MSFCPSCFTKKNIRVDSGVKDTRIYKDKYKVRRRKCKDCNLTYRTIEILFEDYKELSKPKPIQKPKEKVDAEPNIKAKEKKCKKITNENLPEFNEDYEDEVEELRRKYREFDSGF